MELRGWRLWHGTYAVPKPERAGGTVWRRKLLGANFIIYPRNEVTGGRARVHDEQAFLHRLQGPEEDNVLGASYLEATSSASSGGVSFGLQGGAGALYLVQLIPFVTQLGNVRSSAQKRKLDLRWSYGTVLFVFYQS